MIAILLGLIAVVIGLVLISLGLIIVGGHLFKNPLATFILGVFCGRGSKR